MSKISDLIKKLYLALFFVTPLIFTSFNSEYFELPKMYFIYTLTLLITSLHLYNYYLGNTFLFKRSPLTISLIVFNLSQVISTVFSVDSHTSFFGYYSRLNGGLLSLLAFTSLFLIFTNYIDEKLKDDIIWFSLLSGVVVAIFGTIQHFNITQYSIVKNIFSSTVQNISQGKFSLFAPIYSLIHPGFWSQDVQARVFSTFGQPNWLAAYLCILLPISLEKLLLSKTKLTSVSYFLITILFYICLLFTKSKSGIAAAIISLAVLTAIHLYKNLKKQTIATHFKISLSIFFLTITLLSFTLQNPIKDIVFKPKTDQSTPTQTTLIITPSTDIRKIVWKGGLDLWRQFPLIGTGPETFAYTYYWQRPIEHNLTSEWNHLYNKAHNEYLNYLATTGTLGLLAYLLLIASALFFITKSIFAKSPTLPDSLKNTGILASFISILITNSVGFSVAVISIFFFLLPLLATPTTSPPLPPSKKSKIFLLCFLPLIVLSFKLLTFFLADITYAQSLGHDASQNYSSAYTEISKSVAYRPNEPIYLSKFADLSAKQALLNQHDKNTAGVDKNVSDSIAAMEKIIQISPFNLNLWKERAQTYYYLSGIDNQYYLNALDALTKASKLAPTDAMSYYLLGKFYQNASRYDEAIDNYKKSIELKPNYDWATFALGKIYFDQKKYELAKPLFQTTLSVAPTNSEAKDYLAIIATSSAQKK